MDRQLENILDATLKLIRALGEHIQFLHEKHYLIDDLQSWQLIDEIRATCMNILTAMTSIERRIQARGLEPPPEGR